MKIAIVGVTVLFVIGWRQVSGRMAALSENRSRFPSFPSVDEHVECQEHDTRVVARKVIPSPIQ